MNLGGFLDGKAQQPLPPVLIDHEPELYAFQKYCHNLMNKILDLFAIGLEVRFLNYPRASFMDPFLLYTTS
jgi:isopenicillin N synthase-like dioxygenase